VAVAGGLFSGFRSQIAFLGILFVVQFFIEGLWKTLLMPALVMLGILCLAPMLLFASKMPFAVQRALAAFPVNIDPSVRADAAASTEWRYEMWQVVWPEVPRYLLVGKGYSIDPIDLFLTNEAARTGLIKSYEASMVAGDYHNGGLSLLIPFGMFGAIAFVWLLGAGIKVLYCNRRYGDARLRQVNTLLLSYFLTQCVFFFFVFGAFNTQLVVFTGILGFSVSLNGGMCRKQALKVSLPASPTAVMLEPA
jgi:hypothetical protein